MASKYVGLVIFALLNRAYAINSTEKHGKVLSLFQVIRFPNSICSSTTTYNGTCYTSSECTTKGGTSSGSCASGYGVCCTFVLSCGSTSSQNCTYLVQGSTTGLTSPCSYTICPLNSNICRIRFDFMTFDIAGPVTGTATAIGTAASSTASGALGDCTTDAFSISTPGNPGSPVICGLNTGQHMIVDASKDCQKATFTIGGSSATNRAWNIKVSQYACGSNSLGGPPDCLQYFTGASGTISSYNFPTTATSVSATTTHLSNQCYSICIRRESTYCYICFYPKIPTAIAPLQNSFGLSNPASATATDIVSEVDSNCGTDYLAIPGAQREQDIPAAISVTLTTTTRICGRIFALPRGTAASATICTRYSPFKLTFKTNADEIQNGIASMANADELNGMPSGTIGFSLDYLQMKC